MDVIQIVLEVLVLAFVVWSFFKVRHQWPKYYETKGANQATKEDIEEITKKVESIKTDLAKQTEELKAQLSLENQHRLNWKAAEREAYLDLNKKLTDWFYYLTSFSASIFTFDDSSYVTNSPNEFRKRNYETDIALSHFYMFVQDEQTTNVVAELRRQILQYSEALLEEIHNALQNQLLYLNTSEVLSSFEKLKIEKERNKKIEDSWASFESSNAELRTSIIDLFGLWTGYANKRIHNIGI